jgi:hypothetical protein
MKRPLGEYQKNMIDGVLKKYGKYAVKRPIDKTNDPLRLLLLTILDSKDEKPSSLKNDCRIVSCAIITIMNLFFVNFGG